MSDDMALADAVFQSSAGGPVSGSFALPDTRVPLRFGTAPTPHPTGPINPPPHPPPLGALWLSCSLYSPTWPSRPPTF